tara:strand:- start:633 stop:1409 length:777 start_codon:yes stop_codon:yes gene_type:complete
MLNILINLYHRIKRKIFYIKNNYSFHINNFITNFIYGKVSIKCHEFKTLKTDVDEFRKILINSKELGFLNEEENKFKFYQRKKFQNNPLHHEVYKDMGIYTKWFKLSDSEFINGYLKKIIPIIKDNIKSPFSIVNLRAWKSLPNSKPTFFKNRKKGAFRMHTDNFPPGHFKCMVYLSPLDTKHGKFQIEKNLIQSETSGTSILFSNSDYYHQAITGTENDRYAFEITIMRTFTKVNELKYSYGSPNVTYLKNAFFAYL